MPEHEGASDRLQAQGTRGSTNYVLTYLENQSIQNFEHFILTVAIEQNWRS